MTSEHRRHIKALIDRSVRASLSQTDSMPRDRKGGKAAYKPSLGTLPTVLIVRSNRVSVEEDL